VRKVLPVLVVVVLAVVVAVVMSLRRSTPVPEEEYVHDGTPRIVLIGVDGLDWDRVNEYADRGLMPTMARLREEGASGMLRSIPPFVSPTIWTSIATGKVQEKHGISDFLVNKPQPGDTGPTTSNMRKVKAIWQILSAAERTVGVIGWLVTYPADVVNGYLISSHATLALVMDSDKRPPNQTDEWLNEGVHPRGLWTEVVDNMYTEADVSDSALESFIGTSAEQAFERDRMRTAALARFYAADVSALTLARHFSDSMPADFTTVYLRGSDITSHFFWRYMEPESWNKKLSQEELEMFGSVIERYYSFTDSIVGELIDTLAADDTVVMICSDHGFAGHRGYRGFEGEVAKGVEMHRMDGIVFIDGPGIARRRSIEGATILDVTPTLLVLSGLPVARDMDGRPLTEAVTQSFLDKYPVQYIETYELGTGEAVDRTPVESPIDDEIKEMLRSLGYVD
jgi:predicted AlkP superfamily phosphohydrolase/phosphomutase